MLNSLFTDLDRQYMSRAIELAKNGLYTTSPNPRVGCVLVNHQQIVGEGFHIKAGRAHAEVNAIAQAGEKAKGATAYVTLEPCSHDGRTPPCAKALINAGVVKVITAMVDPNPLVSGNGLAILEQAGIVTQSGLLEEEAQLLNLGFIKLMTSGLPYVRCKLAASLDGKTAMQSGESQWITSTDARQDVQRLRAQSCAIISGADSVITDNARMNVRWNDLGDINESYYLAGLQLADLRQPIRVVIDTKNRLTPELALFNEHSPIILVRAAIENTYQWPSFVEQILLPQAKDSQYVDLLSVLKMLGKKGINDVLIESGLSLAGAFVEQNLVDELILYQAPKLIGNDGKGLLAMPSIKSLSQAKQFTFSDVTMIGDDLRIIALLK